MLSFPAGIVLILLSSTRNVMVFTVVAWLKASLQKILMLQVMDRDKRLSNPSYWRDTGYWVGVALDEAAPILLQSVPYKNQSAWLQEIYAALEVRLEVFRRHEEDPDGYGSATLQEIMKEVTQFVMVK